MWFPVVGVKNVYIFPCVPRFLQRKFTKIREIISRSSIHLMEVYFERMKASCPHSSFRSQKFPELQLGSYPSFKQAQAANTPSNSTHAGIEGHRLSIQAPFLACSQRAFPNRSSSGSGRYEWSGCLANSWPGLKVRVVERQNHSRTGRR